MAMVGEFPGVHKHRRTDRAYVNPLDKSTIVSVYPKGFVEIKHTIQPGIFKMSPGSIEKPSILVVGPSSWWRDLGEEQPFLEIPNTSVQVADSIVKDFCNGLLGCNMTDSMPGIFWVPGEHTISKIQLEFRAELDKAQAKQKNYFRSLVQMADGFWARSNGSPLAISEDMRMAAKALGLDSGKDWMKDFTMLAKSECPACGSPYNPMFPVCSVCKAVINPTKAKELGLEFVK